MSNEGDDAPEIAETLAASSDAGSTPPPVASSGMDATVLAEDGDGGRLQTDRSLAASLLEGDELPARIGRFLVVRRLGAGGMGVVFACYDETLDRKVAVKLLRPERVSPQPTNSVSSTGQARLLREAQALARLSHPNIVAVYEVGTWQGQVFVAMEFVDGEPLSAWQRGAERSVAELLGVYRHAGRGLAAAHAAGLIHRDFKPDNVLVGKDGVVRVLDFGLARAAQEKKPRGATEPVPPEAMVVSGSLETSLTQTGAVMGTPAYMAPEQFEGRAVDARTDQFSFCVALYEAVYGERPFAGKTFAALAAAVTHGEVRDEPPFSQVSPALRRLLLRGLSPDPTARYPDMDTLLADLGRDPSARRRRLAAVGMAAIALATAVGIGASWWRAAGRIAVAQRARVEAAFEHATDPRSDEVHALEVDAARLAVQRDELLVTEAIAELDVDPTAAFERLGRLEVAQVVETLDVRWAALAALARGVATASLDVGDATWVRLDPTGHQVAWVRDGSLFVARMGESPRTVKVPATVRAGTWADDRFYFVDDRGSFSSVAVDEDAAVPFAFAVCPPQAEVIAADGIVACGATVYDLVGYESALTTGPAGVVPRLEAPAGASSWRALARTFDGTGAVAVDDQGTLWSLGVGRAPARFEGDAAGVRHLVVDTAIVHGFANDQTTPPRAWSLDHRGSAEPRIVNGARDGARADDGTWIVVDADGRGTLVVTREGASMERPIREPTGLLEVGFARDGRPWTRSRDGHLRIWPLELDVPATIATDLHPKGRLAVHGRIVAHADHTGRLRAWRVAASTGDANAPRRPILDVKPFGAAIAFVEVDPSGRYVAAGTPAGVRIFGVEAGAQVFETELRSGERAQRLAWSNAGDLAIGTCVAGATCTVAIARPEGGAARRLDASSQLTGRLLDLRFSLDGSRVVASDGAGNVAVWDVHGGTVVASAHARAEDASASSAMVLFDEAGHARLVRWSDQHIEVALVTGRTRSQPVYQREGLRSVTVSTADGALMFVDDHGRAWAWDLVTDRVVRWGGEVATSFPERIRVCDQRTRWVGWGGADALWMADLEAASRIDLPIAVGTDLRCGAAPVAIDERRLVHLGLPPADRDGFHDWVAARLGASDSPTP